jgi:capsular polysaccharide biosynthesis protein
VLSKHVDERPLHSGLLRSLVRLAKMLNLSKYFSFVPPSPLRRRLGRINKKYVSSRWVEATVARHGTPAHTGLGIQFLDERQVPGFQLVEQVGGSPPQDPSHLVTPLLSPVIRVEGTNPHEIRPVHQPFDIGVATVPNAWMWAVPFAEDLRNATQEGRWFRFDGAHTIVSLDGYTYSDCLFRNHGVPRAVAIGPDADLRMPSAPPDDSQRLAGEHVFLGDIHNHFGHLLVESVNRLWYLDRMSAPERAKAKFVFFRTWGALSDSLMVPFLRLYGIDIENVLVVDRHTIFESLVVPSPAQRPFNAGIYYSQTMEAWYAELRDRYLAQHKPSLTRSFDRIYLSRGRFLAARQGQRVLAEAEMVEERFRDAGFEIIHPEKLAFEDQLYLASAAREIAGPAGSAHHIAAFATRLERQTILTHPYFFLPVTDASLIMLKGAEITYYFGAVKDATANSLEADWTIVPEIFDAWFARRFCKN